jgi:hypothetical protein
MKPTHLPAAFILTCGLLAGCEHAPSETPPSSQPAATHRDEAPVTSDADLPLATTLDELYNSIGHRVKVRGVAERRKPGPALASEAYTVFLHGVPEWAVSEEGQVFTFAGRVRMRTTLPQPDEGASRQDFDPGTDVYYLEECVRVRE